MKLWDFLGSHSDVSLPKVITIAVISGLSNALLLVIVNSAAHALAGHAVDLRLAILFMLSISIYVVSQRWVLRVVSIEVERIIERLRVRMSDKIRHADLQAIERLGRSQIYAGVNTETLTISQTTPPMLLAAQNAILVAFSLVYIFWLSTTAFFLTIAIVTAGIVVHFNNKKQLMSDLERSTTKEAEFFDVLTHLLEGFKEVKIRSARSRELYQHLREIAGQVAGLKTNTAIRYADYYIITQVLFYLLIGAMVFILPGMSQVYSEQVTRLTSAILFILGPLSMTVSVVPAFRAATHAVENIERLERALDEAQQAALDKDSGVDTAPPKFDTLEMQGVTFSYRDHEDRPLFTVGPLDFTLTRGETLLIVGGNGSGKSTFLKLLTALYFPEAGSLRLDGIDARAIGYQNYRELFSVIYSDYHLFERLYGISDVDNRRVFELLRLMELDRKTTFEDGRFLNQDLSTGQKKRLALIVTLLEDRPIYIFDEWAADQDPTFRKFFYETLIPELKRQGKTIIAATHDDRYFHVGDRILKMEVGQFVDDGGGKA
jgi:putative ATP-binding cassette transporter